MVKNRIKQILDDCFHEGIEQGLWSDAAADSFTVELPKQVEHGDFSTNMAMLIAGRDKKNPREVASVLAAKLSAHIDLFTRVETAGPGFVNFFVRDSVWQSVVLPVCEQAYRYGSSQVGKGKRVLVEFVSANPTGPLSIGHGRQAVLGDAIARLLDATGHDVTREYYYNDAGRQMRVLGESTRARYMELLGLTSEFPEDGYQGEYIYDIARKLVAEKGDSLKDSNEIDPFKEKAEQEIFANIAQTLAQLDIRFDSYYNEHSLYEKGLVDDVVAKLREKGLVAMEQFGSERQILGRNRIELLSKARGSQPTGFLILPITGKSSGAASIGSLISLVQIILLRYLMFLPASEPLATMIPGLPLSFISLLP